MATTLYACAVSLTAASEKLLRVYCAITIPQNIIETMPDSSIASEV